MDTASEALFALKPVTFRYKKEVDSDGIPQFGFSGRGRGKGESCSRRARQRRKTVHSALRPVNAMLLNEFLKEHRRCRNKKRRSRS